MSLYNFKKIIIVPSAKDFVDVILSKTQRKTPTVIHKGYKISRIRAFYTRKVKFTQQNFHDRLSQIIQDFPKLDDVHPFYSDLINVLYDKDHYKLALGQLNVAKNLIDSVARDYVRLLKYGDTLYRCKQLKKAALGRMATIIKRQAANLKYLEEVRQHLSRLPSIDPHCRSIILCGFPNVGKSSFINQVTRAEVEVQPYPFTTKSLYVGHTDYKYLRWQIIDTPGILDHKLEDRNVIEMQSVTALAHLKSCVLYFMDISEQCGFTLQEQISLFESLKPIFTNKPLIVVLNKCDVVKVDDLIPEKRKIIKDLEEDGSVTLMESSTLTGQGVIEIKNQACEQLLCLRIENKMRSKNADNILKHLHVSIPENFEEKEKVLPIIKKPQTEGENDPSRNNKKLEKDIELEMGDDYILDFKKNYSTIPEQERYDIIPEIWDGHNIADYIDLEIFEKLEELEREEDVREVGEFYEKPEISMDRTLSDIREMAKQIRVKRFNLRDEKRLASKKNKSTIPRHKQPKIRERNVGKLKKTMEELGVDMSESNQSNFSKNTVDLRRSLVRVKDGKVKLDKESAAVVRSTKLPLKRSLPRSELGIKDKLMKKKVDIIARKALTNKIRKLALRGEGDHFIGTKKPKHLYSGKRGVGKTDRR